jgi:putative glutamine amidotransferase
VQRVARATEAPTVVGIAQTLDDRGRWRAGRDYVYIDRSYSRAVEDAGGIALHLPIQQDVDALIDRIDALVIPGGDDILPGKDGPTYPAGVSFDPAPDEQLDFDCRLIACAIDRGLPVLGICYGMQLLASLHRGRLHYHLPADLPDAGSHQLPEDEGRHPLEVEPGSQLAEILGPSPAPVNSLHHQGVHLPGEGMRVCARSPDGVIEAIESTRARFVIGVQWHPEKLVGEARIALFRGLLAACQLPGPSTR